MSIKSFDVVEFTEQLYRARKAVSGGNGPRFTRWLPKKWHPTYTEIVLLHCAGWSNKDLAARYGYTEVHISSIVCTPQAALLRRKVIESLQDKVMQSMPEKLEQVAAKTVDRLHQVINDDDIFERSPFSVIDRGMKVLSGLGYLKDSPAVNINKAVILTEQHSKDLIEGLRKAEEAKRLNPG